MSTMLVIGFGNELRGDDGVGPRVARIVAEWNWPELAGIAVHQLTPELAAEVAKADRVVFVDASVDVDGPVRWRSISAETAPASLGHVVTPRWLLGMAEQMFGHTPEAWFVTIPARNLGYGEVLSSAAAGDVRTVSRQIADFARRHRQLSEVVDRA